MVCLYHINFNNLMSTLNVPYMYHKTLMTAIRNKQAPSRKLTDWLPIDNAEEVWSEVQRYGGLSSNRDASTDGQRPSITPQTQSDPDMVPTDLPDEHPIHALAESRRYYHGHTELVPFLFPKQGKPMSKCVVIPTKQQGRPESPTRARIVLREWDSEYVFWTLDINETRFIVRPKGGAPRGGWSYHWWAGPNEREDEDGFHGPIAFSDIQHTATRGSQKSKAQVEYDSDDEYHGASLTDSIRSNRTMRRTIDAADSRGSEDESQPNHPKRRARRVQTDWTLGTPSLGSPAKDGSPPPRRRTESERREIDRLAEEVVERHLQLPLSTKERPSTASIPVRVAQVAQSLSLHSSNSADKTLEAAPMPLSKEKQDRTTLRIRLDRSDSFIGKKFRSCSTTSAFFACIANAWKIEPEEISLVEVALNSAEANGKDNTMIMSADNEDCIEILIEEVDHAPCWRQENGRKILDVFIYRHENEHSRTDPVGSPLHR